MSKIMTLFELPVKSIVLTDSFSFGGGVYFEMVGKPCSFKRLGSYSGEIVSPERCPDLYKRNDWTEIGNMKCTKTNGIWIANDD